MKSKKTNYSYRNASTGSNLEAFMAGYSPETMVTINVVINAAIIAIHGIVNENPIADAIPNPIKIPR